MFSDSKEVRKSARFFINSASKTPKDFDIAELYPEFAPSGSLYR